MIVVLLNIKPEKSENNQTAMMNNDKRDEQS